MGGYCIYCGADFIDSVIAKYCIDCYNKHEEEIERVRKLCDYCIGLCEILDEDPANERVYKKLKACKCGEEQ